MTASYRDIERAERKLAELRETYLRRWGWRLTSNTPSSIWLWRRDFSDLDKTRLDRWEGLAQVANSRGKPAPSKPVAYGVITVDLETAVYMTMRELDDFAKEQGGEA